MKKSKKKEKKPGFTGIKELRTSMKKNTTLYIFLILPIIYFVVFKYIPMFGNIIFVNTFRGNHILAYPGKDSGILKCF